MPSCIVKGCSYSWKKKDPNIILHSFPNDITIIKSWLLQTKQDFGNIDEFCEKVLIGKKTDAFRMCSQHFAMDCYYQRGMITSLKKDALPTIFPEKVIGELGTSKTKSGKPPSKKVCLSAPSTQTWGDVTNNNTTTSIVMGLPLRIVKIEPDFTEPSTSSSIFPQENPFSLSAEFSLEKRKMLEQVHSFQKSSRKSFGTGNTYTIRREGRTVGTNTEYFPGQRHKSTHTDPNIGVKHREVQTEKPKSIQCLCDLPGSPSLQQESSRSCTTLQPGTGCSSSSEICQTEPLQTTATGKTIIVPQDQQSELELLTVASLSAVQCTPDKSMSRSRIEVGHTPMEGSFASEKTVSVCGKELGLSPGAVHNGSELAPLLGQLVSDTKNRPCQKHDIKDKTYTPAKAEEAKREKLEITTVKPEDKDLSGIEIPEATGPQDPFSENKYIVFDSCLNKLLLSCRCLAQDDCDGRIICFKKFFIGSSVSVNAKCSKGHKFHMWDSQP
ncbi:uncharacterized protein LOC142159901 [Mixophyes fleayi]|uniref:uncharacterized protein LOC142159901 n=1 Tax=Mixophyes fleayi TaxID=3061075 RepID=UPI003F4E3F85